MAPNTVAAVVAALGAGADGAEFDVRMSADGVVVMHHDAYLGAGDLEAGCGVATGTAISAVKRAEVPHLSTLGELLDAVKAWAGDRPGRCPVLNVELKDLPGEPGWDEAHTLAREVARLCSGADVGEWPGPAKDGQVRVIVSSFDPEALVELRRQAPRLSTGLLLAPGGDWRGAVRAEGGRAEGGRAEGGRAEGGWRALHPAQADASEELFGAAEKAGLAVVPWTVDDTDRAIALAAMGASAVITNRPRSVLAALGRHI
ncbi:MAG: glycerophosphodiester phosphodiesterase [Actinobacteria bacterium]|nr:glycerophosphodiester phosphodiesterase [Actinomycetota bacterium]